MKKSFVLVLGSGGLVGSTVYQYLKNLNSGLILEANRNSKLLFTVENYKKNLDKILKKYKVNFIINCVGITNKINADNNQVILVNSLFPHELAKYCKKLNINIVHASTDAVFNPLSGTVTEKSQPNPTDFYGLSKLMGESDLVNVLNIRTSLIGPSKTKKEGLWEWIKNSKKNINGFSNQKWSGCTTLQFAKLCNYIIFKNKFDILRKKSNLYHFTPLGPVTKYALIKEIAKQINPRLIVKKTDSQNKISRIITPNYFDKKFLNSYTTNLRKAITEAVDFEKNKND